MPRALPIKCCRVTPGHVSFSVSARAFSTIRSSQGLLHSLLSSACFTHSYWFFIDLRSPPVPPLFILSPIHHQPWCPPPFPVLLQVQGEKEDRVWHWFLRRLFSPSPSIPVLVSTLPPSLVRPASLKRLQRGGRLAAAGKGAEAVSE